MLTNRYDAGSTSALFEGNMYITNSLAVYIRTIVDMISRVMSYIDSLEYQLDKSIRVLYNCVSKISIISD